jgi:hypothetical protein
MSARLDWQIGPAGDDDGVVLLPTPRVVPQRAARRLVLTPRLLGFYLVALLAAGFVGFGLGRWSEGRSALRAGLERAIGLEVAAWRAADGGLMGATLDPLAPAGWRFAALQDFARRAPAPTYAVRLVSVRGDGGDHARATVEIRAGEGVELQDRTYRASGGGWYLTPPSRVDTVGRRDRPAP